MAGPEDAATVLDQFIHDAANLPAEICHMMEEIQAKDRDLQRHQIAINAKDGSLQKHLKLNGSLNAHPKEKEYSDAILKNYDQCIQLQNDKIKLSNKACHLLDRQLKTLDSKIQDLQNDGQLLDGPPIPSIFNRKPDFPDLTRQFLSQNRPILQQPLQTTSGNTPTSSLNPSLSAYRLNSQHHLSPSINQQSSSRLTQHSSSTHSALNPRAPTPTTPAAQSPHPANIPRPRESSTGADPKKRRLNIPTLPAQSSNLRQSSLGPGTPKAGTPTPRAGSAGPRSASLNPTGPKKSATLPKKLTPHHLQIAKLKGKPGKRPSSLNKRKGQSPSVRSRAGADNDDDASESADETDASSTTRSRRGGTAGAARASSKTATTDAADEEQKKEKAGVKKRRANKKAAGAGAGDGAGDVDMDDADGDSGSDEGEDGEPEDDRTYCFCNRVSFGEMVGCENDKCAKEWFHLECVGLKAAPKDSDIWYCPDCAPLFTPAVKK